MLWLLIGWPVASLLVAGYVSGAAHLGKTEAESQAVLQEEYMAACLSGDERLVGATSTAFIERGAK